ncbi:N-acetylmuramoyl-L-alanine amidase [Nocardia sp. SSK8]|uniref:N-acetylmuramoyl-L-alanine amidase n=1 Tax=Nocardia sp. SSK8 TaxID=3120154 RepID=UPI003FA612D5
MQPNIINAGLCSAVSAAVVVSLSGLMPVTAHAAPPGQASDRLVGKTIFLDPGHQGPEHAENLSRQVDNGRGGTKDCQTTGMTSLHGIPEHTINWEVAQLVKASLQALGADVVLSRDDDSGWGGCVDDRARAANESGAQVAVSIHADSAPADQRGFHLIVPELPIPDTVADHAQAGAGRAASSSVRDAYRAAGFPAATYAGVQDGLQTRADIAGPALTQVPLVFVEMGNGANAEDAALLESREGQLKHALAIATGVVGFLMNAPVAGTTPVDATDQTTGAEAEGSTAPGEHPDGTATDQGSAPADGTDPSAPPAGNPSGTPAEGVSPDAPPATGTDEAPGPEGAPANSAPAPSPDPAGTPEPDPAAPLGADTTGPNPAGEPTPAPADQGPADQAPAPADPAQADGAVSAEPPAPADASAPAPAAPAPADGPAPAEPPAPEQPTEEVSPAPAASPISLFAPVRHPVADPPKPPTGSSGHLTVPGDKKPDPLTTDQVAPKPPTGSSGGLTIPADPQPPAAPERGENTAPEGVENAIPGADPTPTPGSTLADPGTDQIPTPGTDTLPTPDSAPGTGPLPVPGANAVPTPGLSPSTAPGQGAARTTTAVPSAAPNAIPAPGTADQGLGLVPAPGAGPAVPPAVPGGDSVPAPGSAPIPGPGSVPTPDTVPSTGPDSTPSTGAARTTTAVPSAPPSSSPTPTTSRATGATPDNSTPMVPPRPTPARAPINDPAPVPVAPVRTAPPGAPAAPAPTPRERGTTPKSQVTPEESTSDLSSLSSAVGGPVLTIMNLLMPMAQALGMDNSAATSQLINLAYTLAGVIFGPTK